MELLASLGREALVSSSSNSPDHPSGGGLPLAGQAGRQYFLLVEQADWACERGTLSNPENQIRIKGVNVPTSVSQTGDLNRAQYYELIRNQIEHEDQTVNQRVIWQIISQAFFFGAYASLVTAPQQARDPVFQALQQFLLWAMPMSIWPRSAPWHICEVSMRTMRTKGDRMMQAANSIRTSMDPPRRAVGRSLLRSRCRWSLSSHGSPSLRG
jgi:hypothetical protein